MNPPMLFPKYLNKGSRGPAVALLQVVLVTHGLGPEVIIDGDYGEKTALAVADLQTILCVEDDGNFGPNTRAAFLRKNWVNFDTLPAALFQGETVPA